jgi:hypothetical protein
MLARPGDMAIDALLHPGAARLRPASAGMHRDDASLHAGAARTHPDDARLRGA